MRREEALRWLVLDAVHRNVFTRYLSSCVRDPGGSYWFINLSACGIAQDIFIKEIGERADGLYGHFRLLDTLGIKEPVTLLVENRETVVIRNQAELAEVFALIKKTMGK